MTTGVYNSTEVQFVVRTKYVPSPGRLRTNPGKIDESLPSKWQQSQNMMYTTIIIYSLSNTIPLI